MFLASALLGSLFKHCSIVLSEVGDQVKVGTSPTDSISRVSVLVGHTASLGTTRTI